MDTGYGDLASLRQQMAARRSSATQGLTGKSNSAQPSDELSSLAAKRNGDRIRLSVYMLRQQLVKDLDQTIQTQMSKHPEIEGKFFVGIVTGERYSAEVVGIEEAASRVTDAPREEALEVLRQNPIGYFAPEDFTMKTGDDPAFRDFKQGLDDYLRRNQQVIQYLQSHPEDQVSADQLYKRPPGM
jgi:hypothetical protein